MSMRHGDRDKAKAALKGLIAYDPTVTKNPAQVLIRIGLFPDVAQPLADRLMAGMTALDK